ncbi:MAG: SUMF1/EgtB/PvdO family nonheme iron enzyme [Planctomycetes bacterium]|nr:SUMF1/EgtB/PvdO family nonheme iron enzyme [Planctomycetota bacterium]
MDSRFPLLLEEMGFLPAGAAREAAASEDPVGYAMGLLAAQGKIEEALEALLATNLPDQIALRAPIWCERARQFLAVTAADRKGRHSAFGLTRAATDLGGEEGAQPATTPADRPGGSLAALPDRYEVKGVLGRGGMGTVYEVHDSLLGRTVALKILEHGTPQQKRRFFSEARATALLGHPNILPCYTARTDSEGRPYYTMMRVEGRTLERALREATPLPLEPALRALAHAARAVAHAHRQKMIHRDLKPANIMLGEHGEVWVVDWGLVRSGPLDEPGPGGVAPFGHADGRLTATGDVLGTPAYLSPEQARSDPGRIGPHTDVYGLGAILYEILTRTPPNNQKSLAQIFEALARGAVERPSSRAPEREIPPALEATCLRAMAPARARRYASADDLADDLEAYLARQPVSAYAAPLPARAAAWVRRHLVACALAAVLALAALGAAAVLGGRARLEAAAASSRESQKTSEENDRRDNAEKGLEAALADARKAHAARLGALEDYARPFEKIYTGNETPGELRDRVFLPATDSRIARAEDDWLAAATEARIHLATLAGTGSSDLAPRQREIDLQELEWAIESALAAEGAIIESRWIERLRQNEAPFWKLVIEIVNRGVTNHRAGKILAGTGKLETPALPGTCKAVLAEVVTSENPFGRRIVVERVDSWGETLELLLGSYDLEVTRGETTFHFPVLVERDRTKRLDIVVPKKLREGFIWIPPGDFLAGGDAEDAFPRHRRRLEKGFFMARTEVTRSEHLVFLFTESDRTKSDGIDLLLRELSGQRYRPVLPDDLSTAFQAGSSDGPAFGVTRMAAEEYLGSRGCRLPTEFEWERAAGGADGRVYVWGDLFGAGFANVGTGSRPADCGTHPRDESIFEVLDLGGSLREWTSTDLPSNRVSIRGGSWGFGEEKARRAYRFTTLSADSPRPWIGIRAAADPE